MELYSLDQCIDRSIGKKGTPERDKFDAEVKAELEAYRIGEAIRETRKRQKLTQKQLGERVGVGEAQISKIESGKSITYSTIVRVFQAMGAHSAVLDMGRMGRVALW
jgi:ribosome-binding protein aMBF1 (putative translation factor)